jgi:methanogenic corrinoid protein MtbC1
MSDGGVGPASNLGRRGGSGRPRRGRTARPYPAPDRGASGSDVALAAVRALVHAEDPHAVRQVVATLVGDLGGALVPARLEPRNAIEVDVSLGLGDPTLVVVDALSVAALDLRSVLPAVLDDARAVLARMAREGEPPPPAGGTGPAAPQDLQRHLELVTVGDVDGARRHTLGLLRRGVSRGAVVEQVLAPAQREVGDRWYRGAWSVADEHAATAVTEACLGALPLATEGPSLLLVSPEGEWHSLPSRMAAVAADGVRARALGPGLPASHLQRYLEVHDPEVLALSCTMATNLISAARSIAAAQLAGVPVIAGGRAFGGDDRRAAALGADAWAGSAAELGRVVPISGEPPLDVPHEAVLADAVADELLQLVLERQAAATGWVREMDRRQQREALQDLRWITRHAAAALACDDPTVLDELLHWLDVLLTDRGVPAHVLPDATGYLADALEVETPQVAELVRTGGARLR